MDHETLRRLCLLLSQLHADATDYTPFTPEMIDRMGELNEHRSLFLDSRFAGQFRDFWNAAGSSIEFKRTYFSQQERTELGNIIRMSYPALKAALNADYEKTRP